MYFGDFFAVRNPKIIVPHLHRNVKYDAEVHMNLMNGLRSFWE